MQRIPLYNGDPHDMSGKLLSNFIPFAVLKSQNRRVYSDEIPLPDREFCIKRVSYLINKDFMIGPIPSFRHIFSCFAGGRYCDLSLTK